MTVTQNTKGCRGAGWLSCALLLLLAAAVRTVGLYRGLDADAVYHPDEPKQVMATARTLANEYGTFEHKPGIDAYPLFVSRLDAWIIRAVRAPLRLLNAWLNPESPFPEVPEKADLYRWTRALRVLYELLTLILTLAIARAIGFSPPATLFSGLLLALCPLSQAVAHFSTGEAGMDLFGAAAVLLLTAHARNPRLLWLAASAFCVGWAFDSKYHGVLIGVVTAIYLPARWVVSRSGWRQVLSETSISLAGFVAGVVLGTPQWFWDHKRYWRDFLANLRFIKDYAVPPEIRALPAWRRALMSFESNLPKVFSGLGWLLAFLGLAGLIWAIIALRRSQRVEQEGPFELRRRWLRAAIFAFPPIALIVSLAGKLMLQAIHFSNLAPFFALAAAYAISRLWQTQRSPLRIAAAALGGAAVFELGALTEREIFFWRRDDITRVTREFRRAFTELAPVDDFRRGRITATTLRYFTVEGDNPSGFRNRPYAVYIPNAQWWRSAHIAPVPTTPMTSTLSWVFTEGPVLPRSDREFPAPAGRTTRRHVVWYRPPGTVSLGFRSGRIPALVEVDYGGDLARIELEPHQQIIRTFSPRRWRTQPRARQRAEPVFLVPLNVRAITGAVTVHVLADPREVVHFRAFGGDPEAARALAADLPDRDELLDALADTRFSESPDGWSVFLSASNTRESLSGLPPLPAGRYRLQVDVDIYQPDTRLSLSLLDVDHRAGAVSESPGDFILAPGLHRLEWRFTKGFAPYDPRVMITANLPCRLHRWTLAPDAQAIHEDLSSLREGGSAPQWCRRYGPIYPVAPRELPVGARYGRRGAIEIVSLYLPEKIGVGQPFPCAARVRLHGAVRWAEHSVYVRLVDETGHTVWSFRPRVVRAAYGDTPAAFDLFTPPETIPAAQYAVYVRLFNERVFLRQPLYSAISSARVERQWIRAGEVNVAKP